MFKAVLIEKDEAGYRAAVKEVDDADLPAGDVTVRVAWSTLNYKDGLAITGKSPVVRSASNAVQVAETSTSALNEKLGFLRGRRR